jgi:hypothetical protein
MATAGYATARNHECLMNPPLGSSSVAVSLNADQWIATVRSGQSIEVITMISKLVAGAVALAAAAIFAPASAAPATSAPASMSVPGGEVQLVHYRHHRHWHHHHRRWHHHHYRHWHHHHRHCHWVCHGYWHRGHCHGHLHRRCHW